jgi:hypothetical protein
VTNKPSHGSGRPSSSGPDKPSFRFVLTGRCVRTECGTRAACRLHARVRLRRGSLPRAPKRRDLLRPKQKANRTGLTGCPCNELPALQGPKHLVNRRGRDAEVRPEVRLGGRPSMEHLVAMDECQILTLFGRVAEPAGARSNQVRPRIYVPGKAAVQSGEQTIEPALGRLILGEVRRLLHQRAELAGILTGQVQAYDRSGDGTGPENVIENTRRLDVGKQEIALLRSQLEDDF